MKAKNFEFSCRMIFSWFFGSSSSKSSKTQKIMKKSSKGGCTSDFRGKWGIPLLCKGKRKKAKKWQKMVNFKRVARLLGQKFASKPPFFRFLRFLRKKSKNRHLAKNSVFGQKNRDFWKFWWNFDEKFDNFLTQKSFKISAVLQAKQR